MIDLVFMIDGSSSFHQIEKVVYVVKFILSYLPDLNTSVGVVLYTSEATTMSYFNFTRNQTLDALHNVSSLPAGKLIGTSLNYTRQHFFTKSRPNVHRVLVVFTHSTSSDAVSVASKLLHNMNVTILVVALGDWYDIAQIESAASYPHSNTILLTTYVQLVKISWRVHEMICEGKKNKFFCSFMSKSSQKMYAVNVCVYTCTCIFVFKFILENLASINFQTTGHS